MTSVRRTVVVAVALVTGQALLCGIIGFVTFGDNGGATPGVRAAEPQLAGPPVVVPPASTPSADERPERPRPGTPRPTRTERPTSPPGSAAARSSATREISPSRTASVPPAPPELPPVPPPTEIALLPPVSPTSDDDAPEPVVEKERCDEPGALGTTAAGRTVRCERARDGELRWRLV